MSLPAVFTYTDQQVRTVVIDAEPWFVLADVCAVLDLSNPSMVASRLDGDALSTTEVIDSMGRRQSARIVNEPGLYEVIFLSRKPEARAFKRWVTREVLPTIRRTGQFGSQVPATFAEALELAAAHQRRIEAAEAKIAEDAPKVEAYDALMDADGFYSMEAAGKVIGVGRNTLFRMLRDDQVLTSANLPAQRHMHHFKVTTSTYTTPDGVDHTRHSTRVRPSGIEWLARRYGSLSTPALEEL